MSKQYFSFESVRGLNDINIYSYLKENSKNQYFIMDAINHDMSKQKFISNDLFIELIKDGVISLDFDGYFGNEDIQGNLFEISIVEKDCRILENIILSGKFDLDKCKRLNLMMLDIFNPNNLTYNENGSEKSNLKKDIKETELVIRLLEKYDILSKIPKQLFEDGGFLEECKKKSPYLKSIIENCRVMDYDEFKRYMEEAEKVEEDFDEEVEEYDEEAEEF